MPIIEEKQSLQKLFHVTINYFGLKVLVLYTFPNVVWVSNSIKEIVQNKQNSAKLRIDLTDSWQMKFFL